MLAGRALAAQRSRSGRKADLSCGCEALTASRLSGRSPQKERIAGVAACTSSAQLHGLAKSDGTNGDSEFKKPVKHSFQRFGTVYFSIHVDRQN